MAAVSPIDMALALLAPLSMEEKLAFLVKFTATISGSKVSEGAAAEKVKTTKKGKKATDAENAEVASTSSSQKRSLNPVAASIMEKALEIRTADIQKHMGTGLTEEEAKKAAMKHTEAVMEAGILIRMERDGVTREEAEEVAAKEKSKRDEAKAKRNSKKNGGAAVEPAKKAEAKPAAAAEPAKKAEVKPSAVAEPAKKAEVKPSAVAEPAKKAEVKPAAEPAAAKPAKKPETKSAVAAKVEPKKAEPAYELVEGEDMDITTMMRNDGYERMCAGDGIFYYVHTKTNEAFDLEGNEVGCYDKESDSIIAC